MSIYLTDITIPGPRIKILGFVSKLLTVKIKKYTIFFFKSKDFLGGLWYGWKYSQKKVLNQPKTYILCFREKQILNGSATSENRRYTKNITSLW